MMPLVGATPRYMPLRDIATLYVVIAGAEERYYAIVY